MFGRKYDVISQNGDYSRGSTVRTFSKQSVTRKQHRYNTQYRKVPPSDIAIRWLKQFQETGRVLHRKGAGKLSISQEENSVVLVR
jgi:hypothetical protein